MRKLNVLKASADVRLAVARGDNELEGRTGKARFDYKFDQVCSPCRNAQMDEVPFAEDDCIELMSKVTIGGVADPGRSWCRATHRGSHLMISPHPRSFRSLRPSMRLSSRRYAQTSSYVSSTSHYREPLSWAVTGGFAQLSLKSRYYYEDMAPVCSLSGNFIASDHTQCKLYKSVSGDHVPLDQDSDAKRVA